MLVQSAGFLNLVPRMVALDCSAAIVEDQVTARVNNTDRRFDKATLIGNWYEERSKYRRECFKHDSTYRQHYRVPEYDSFLGKRDKPSWDVKQSQSSVSGSILEINPFQVNQFVTTYDLAYDRHVEHGSMTRTKPTLRALLAPWNEERRANVCTQQFATTRGILPSKQKLWNYDKSFENPCAAYPSSTLHKCEFWPASAAEYKRNLEQTRACANRAYNNRPARVLNRHLDGYAARGVRHIRVVPDVLVNLPPGCSVRAPTATGCLQQSCARRIDHSGLKCRLSTFPNVTQ